MQNSCPKILSSDINSPAQAGAPILDLVLHVYDNQVSTYKLYSHHQLIVHVGVPSNKNINLAV